MKTLQKLLLLLSLGAFAVPAFAVVTPVDVTMITDTITANITPATAVAAGVLIFLVSVKVYKWIRRAL